MNRPIFPCQFLKKKKSLSSLWRFYKQLSDLLIAIGTYEEAQVLHASHLLSGNIILILHSNSDWFYQHLTAPQLEAQLNHDSI